jgi:hypothetical protein
MASTKAKVLKFDLKLCFESKMFAKIFFENSEISKSQKSKKSILPKCKLGR